MLRLTLQAADWILVFLALPGLPALWDFVSNPVWRLELNDTMLSWTGPRSDQIALSGIDHVRLDTRWDLSVRATIFLASGHKIRIPDPALPPHRRFETELNAQAVRTERHHFLVF